MESQKAIKKDRNNTTIHNCTSPTSCAIFPTIQPCGACYVGAQNVSIVMSLFCICDPLSETRHFTQFELEAILSMQVVSQLNSDYYTNVSQGAWTVSY